MTSENEPDAMPIIVDETDVPQGLQFSLATLLLVVTLVAVYLAIFSQSPGIGITLAMLSLPAFVRTANLVSARRRAGRSTSFFFRAVSFVGSLIVTTVALSVVTVASIGTFCAVCLSAASNGNGGGEIAIVVAGLVAITVTVVVVALLVMFIRWRFRRDAEKP